MKRATVDLWPTYVFRPLQGVLHLPLFRYSSGEWIEDDGEPNLAFSSVASGVCLYVSLPYQKNIILSWLTTHWCGYQPKHPRGNAWHYMLRPGETKWGGSWGRESHENTQAGDSGMKFITQHRAAASGLHIELKPEDKHIAAGLVTERKTGKPLVFPTNPMCMYCGCGIAAEVPE